MSQQQGHAVSFCCETAQELSDTGRAVLGEASSTQRRRIHVFHSRIRQLVSPPLGTQEGWFPFSVFLGDFCCFFAFLYLAKHYALSKSLPFLCCIILHHK